MRTIFRGYLETHSIEAVHRRLQGQGFRRKVWKARTGAVFGGGIVTLSSLHHILRNPIYVGEVSHRGEVYPGIHQPIVERHVFEEVQKALALHSQRHPRVPANLLTGLLFDSAGRPMCVKAYTYKGRQIRYYASNVSAWARRRKLKRMRADGNGLEQLVIASLKTLLLDREQLRPILLGHGIHRVELDSLTRAGSTAARRFDGISDLKLGDVLRGILQRVELTASHVTLLMWIEELRRFLAWDGVGMFGTDADGRQRNPSIHFHCVAASVVRARKLFALPVPAAIWNGTPRIDNKLIRLLDDAERARTLMMVRRDLDLPGLAAEFGCKMDRYSRLVRLSYLAPDIALAIRDGMEPVGLTRRTLIAANIPLDWATQRTLLGFPPQPQHLRNPNAAPVRPVPDQN